jgi:hypothetical protein
VNAVLSYEAFEDERNCRLIANRRLDSLRAHLLGLCGLLDDDVGGKPPKATVEPSGHANIARVLVKIEERRAKMFGFDAPQHVVTQEKNPFDSMTPEELMVACEENGIPIPPGLRQEVAARAQRVLEGAQMNALSPTDKRKG